MQFKTQLDIWLHLAQGGVSQTPWRGRPVLFKADGQLYTTYEGGEKRSYYNFTYPELPEFFESVTPWYHPLEFNSNADRWRSSRRAENKMEVYLYACPVNALPKRSGCAQSPPSSALLLTRKHDWHLYRQLELIHAGTSRKSLANRYVQVAERQVRLLLGRSCPKLAIITDWQGQRWPGLDKGDKPTRVFAFVVSI